MSDGESRLFAWCADLLSKHDGDALREQIGHAEVIDEDIGGLWFRVSPKELRLGVGAVDLMYDDRDGGPVEFIIAFVEGYLNWVDRYRADGTVLQHVLPEPAEIRSWEVRTE